MKSWLEYWNRPNGAFVSEWHKRAYYERLFSNVQSFLPRGPGSAMLDWGCGEALAAERMAAECERVYLFDPTELVRSRLHRRCGDHSHITVIDAEQLRRLSSGSLDLILINSVIEYLNRAELLTALSDLSRLLRDSGRFLIGDVISPGTALWQHVVVFLTFAYQSGFMASAIVGLLCKFLPSYNSVQRGHGLSKYSEAELMNVFQLCKLDGKRLSRNIAVSPIRSSYIATKSTQQIVSLQSVIA
jgi:ubiquinone/menaquinone biosynthesis C-methylase UbiE